MFKEYKLLKLSFGLILLVFVLFQWNKGIENSVSLYTDKVSYNVSEEIKIVSPEIVPVEVKSIGGKVVYTGTSSDVLPPLSKGLYVINERFPIVVKGEKETKVTIVFPLVNNILFNDVDGKAYINQPSDSLSLNSPSYLDELDFNLCHLVEDLNISYNVITDFDLEKDELWKNSRCVIIYGKSKFYTALMNKKLRDYLDAGGNVLLLSSCFSHYQISIDTESKNIVKVRDSVNAFARNRDKIPVYESYGGEANSNALVLKTDSKEIKIVTSNWSNFFNMDEGFEFDSKGELKIQGEYRDYAEIGEIRFKTNNTGVAYLIGSEDVLLNVNMQNGDWKKFLSSALLGLIGQ